MLQENWNYRKYEHEYSCVELPHKVHKFNINHELSIPQAHEQLKGNIDIGISPPKNLDSLDLIFLIFLQLTLLNGDQVKLSTPSAGITATTKAQCLAPDKRHIPSPGSFQLLPKRQQQAGPEHI